MEVSDYVKGLPTAAKDRYIEKLNIVGLSSDPYLLKDVWDCNPEEIADIKWPDIALYMLETPSPHTKQRVNVSKCFRSYNLYKLFKFRKGIAK